MARADTGLGDTGLIATHPIGVLVCEVSSEPPPPDKRVAGARLGPGPAGVLATLLDRATSAGALAIQCAAQPPEELLRFSYQGGHDVDVGVISFGCPATIAYVAGKARLLDRTLSQVIVVTAGDRGTGLPVPDLYGRGPGDAIDAATRSGFTVLFSGEEIDPDVPSGAVVLQDPPAGMSGIGNQISVVLAAHPSPGCTIGELALDYYGGGAGAGNDFGTIYIRDVGMQPCLLRGPIEVEGADRAGRTVTQVITYSVEPALVLSPSAARIPVGQMAPLGEVVADLQLAAEHRDDPMSPNGLCDEHQVIPAFWRLTFPDGVRSVANRSDAPAYPRFSSLLTCRGELDTPQPITAALP